MRYYSNLGDIQIDNKDVKRFRNQHIYFLRKVTRSNNDSDKSDNGIIVVLGERIDIPKEHINCFVFCDLIVNKKQLYVGFENDQGDFVIIKSVCFTIKNVIF